jgi:hypothetical protein
VRSLVSTRAAMCASDCGAFGAIIAITLYLVGFKLRDNFFNAQFCIANSFTAQLNQLRCSLHMFGKFVHIYVIALEFRQDRFEFFNRLGIASVCVERARGWGT